MLVFVGASFAADKVVDAKIKEARISSLKEQKKVLAGETNCCSVTVKSGGYTVSGSACCKCTTKTACATALAFAGTFF